MVHLSDEVRNVLCWWIKSLTISSGKSFPYEKPDLTNYSVITDVINSDASLYGLRFFAGKLKVPGHQRIDRHINELELLAALNALTSITASV